MKKIETNHSVTTKEMNGSWPSPCTVINKEEEKVHSIHMKAKHII